MNRDQFESKRNGHAGQYLSDDRHCGSQLVATGVAKPSGSLLAALQTDLAPDSFAPNFADDARKVQTNNTE